MVTCQLFKSSIIVQFQIINNNTCHFSNCDQMFKKYKIIIMNQHNIYIKQLQQSFNVRFEDYDLDKVLFSTFANPFEHHMKILNQKSNLSLLTFSVTKN